MNHFWELEDKIWDLVVTDPAPATDREALDHRAIVRYDQTSLDVPVVWMRREFRDNPPVALPLIVLTPVTASSASRAGNRVAPIKIRMSHDSSYVTYRTSPDWYDISFQVSVYSRTRRMFHDIVWDAMNEIFPMGYGARWMEIASGLPLEEGAPGSEALVGPGPVSLKKEVVLGSYTWGVNRTEDLYTGNLSWTIKDVALFRFRDLANDMLQTITEWNVRYEIENGSGGTELVVYDFVTDSMTVTE